MSHTTNTKMRTKLKSLLLILALIAMAFPLPVEAGKKKKKDPIVIVVPPVPAPVPARPPSGIPAGAFLVAPFMTGDGGIDGSGRHLTYAGYQLELGHLYEFQFSDDVGSTWRHQYVSGVRPEPLIGATNLIPFGLSYVWNSYGTGGRIFRYVDFTNATTKPGPWSGPQ